ncbi:MAG: hypothetical protein PVG49_21690 [Desulfobacteraceae bacterium]|jgi:hypothetical protein
MPFCIRHVQWALETYVFYQRPLFKKMNLYGAFPLFVLEQFLRGNKELPSINALPSLKALPSVGTGKAPVFLSSVEAASPLDPLPSVCAASSVLGPARTRVDSPVRSQPSSEPVPETVDPNSFHRNGLEGALRAHFPFGLLRDFKVIPSDCSDTDTLFLCSIGNPGTDNEATV